jgi:hypothetical protein
MTTRRGTKVAVALGVLALGVAPASANNPLIEHQWAKAKYIDVTDQLCAKVASYMDTSASWATAEIRLSGDVLWSKSDYGNSDNVWACTGNLSIPEDKQYVLVVKACTIYANPLCTSVSTTFYS